MKVAIVDDSLFMRRLIRENLKEIDSSITIVEFDDPVVALTEVPKAKPDLVTLDNLMPEMNGSDVLKNWRNGDGADLRVVVITADIQASVRERCEELGIVDFIEKPVTVDKLRVVIEKNAKLAAS